jgi:hypothetical protein
VKSVRTISSEQLDFLRRFYYLLDTIEEGFSYILSSFDDIQYVERDQVLMDIIVAMKEIDSTRHLFDSLFPKDFSITEEMGMLDEMMEKLDFISFQPVHLEPFIKQELYPTYVKWKDLLQKKLKKYVTH